jgi:hypothetical protein
MIDDKLIPTIDITAYLKNDADVKQYVNDVVKRLTFMRDPKKKTAQMTMRAYFEYNIVAEAEEQDSADAEHLDDDKDDDEED